jgi:hypothetical protein
MPFVLVVDQAASRDRADLIDLALQQLGSFSYQLPFVRTVGDELQGLVGDAATALEVVLFLLRPHKPDSDTGLDWTSVDWHVGLGIGPVASPLPADVRAGRGPAFLAARRAVEQAKGSPLHLCIETVAWARSEGLDAELVIKLLLAIRQRRTVEGWQAVDQASAGYTHAEIAANLGITRQAVGQRLAAANWWIEVDARQTITRLLARAERQACT